MLRIPALTHRPFGHALISAPLWSGCDPPPVRVSVDELQQALRYCRELPVIYHDDATFAESGAGVMPVNHWEWESVTAVDQDEVQRGSVERGKHVLRPADVERQAVVADVVRVEVADARLHFSWERGDTRVVRPKEREKDGGHSDACFQRPSPWRRASAGDELVAVTVGVPQTGGSSPLSVFGKDVDLRKISE